MGTNFYTLDGKHIGKRSSAGWYCWDCGKTLCTKGEKGIHDSSSEWYNNCQICGKPRTNEPFSSSASGRELGFNKFKPKKKKGIASCSSFIWAMDSDALKKKKVVVDEHKKRYTIKQFRNILEECPIRFFKIGEEFS